MTSKTQIRILSVDDHPVVRRGIAAILATEPSLSLVGEAATGADAVRLYRDLHPDIVLMDLRLAGSMDGVQATSSICEEWPRARVIVLTTYAGDEDIHRGRDEKQGDRFNAHHL